jgi:broad specificity phosphatase PhoE
MQAATQSWPSALWLVRHGESAGNVARDLAEKTGVLQIDVAARDADVPLSSVGEQQARALGQWFRRLPVSQQPTVLLTSPYARAVQTAALVQQAWRDAGGGVHYQIDERLREKEFGALNRLTRAGIARHFPDQVELRSQLGKFYYRPPGGESWCDVILRLRSVLADLRLQHPGQGVLVVAHQVIVLCFRYLIERMTEDQLLEIDRAGDIANCSVTHYEAVPDPPPSGQMVLRCYNFVAPLEESGQPITSTPDAPTAPR